ncbi:MAG: protein kinase domain-containing protein [Blastocatellia bacterium]
MHEPISGSSAFRFVGRQSELDSLAQRILFSDGGSFLVTGYRGVGKTSFINQVIRQLEVAARWAGAFLGRTEVVDIYLNIARPIQPGELMHHIIRRLYDRLTEKGVYQSLDKNLQDELTLAYQRTSVNMARKLAEASERNFGFNEASLGGEWLKATVKASWNSKQSRTQNYEMSFLGYDDKAAEHDIIRLSRLLAAGYVKPENRLTRLRRVFAGHETERTRLKIVFVFDELDKLEEFKAKAEDDSKPVIDQILGALKNLFTTSGVTFIFVAGKDLQERWLEDVGKGDSVYESVFSYDKYLPCMWADVNAVCDGLVDWDRGLTSYEKQVFTDFKMFLTYKGRGIPRRIIRTFNEYVEWSNNYPALAFTRQSLRRVRFYAGLQEALAKNDKLLFGESHEEALGTQSDKRRLGVYYLIDWIVNQSAAEFTLKDVLRASGRLSVKIALAEEIAPAIIEEIIRILVEHDYLEEMQKGLDQVVIGNAVARDERKYRVAPRRLVEMGGSVEEVSEDALLFAEAGQSSARRKESIKRIGHYNVIHLIGQGGMGTVYKVTDDLTGMVAAVKVLSEDLGRREEFVQRFEREANVMSKLHHPNIVQFYDWGIDAEGRSYIAMEYLDALTLDSIIARLGKMGLEFAVPIAIAVAEAAHYINEQGYVRNDIKPHNIMLTTAGRVCLLDFGITKSAKPVADTSQSAITAAGAFVGTPLYAAPEQFDRGEADARADIYSVGVVLYRMLTGVLPFDGDGAFEIIRAHLNQKPEPPSKYAFVPAEVEAVVLKCLEKKPEDRFQTGADFVWALTDAIGSLAPADLSSLVSKVKAEVAELEAVNRITTLVPSPDSLIVPQAAIEPDEAEISLAGEQIARPIRWNPAATIETAPAASPEEATEGAPSKEDPYLILIASDDEKSKVGDTSEMREYKLLTETSIGRSPQNVIALNDAKVSRHHASINYENGVWILRDLNSFRGAYVNEARVIESCRLADGDKIRLGDSVFVLRLP